MARRRKWKKFVPRFFSELNVYSGLIGIIGVSLSLMGILIDVPALWNVSIFIFVVTIGYMLYQAVPPLTRKPERIVGKTLELTELDNIDAPILRLAVVGIVQAGKTTLKQRLQLQEKTRERTQSVTAQVIYLPGKPSRFVAVLDGRGDRFADQFEIASAADLICLVLDHNSSNENSLVDEDRLNEHTDFLTQLRHHLRVKSEIKWLNVLANKRDLWEQEATQIPKMESFCLQEISKWYEFSSGPADWKPHSNEKPDDIARFKGEVAHEVSNEDS